MFMEFELLERKDAYLLFLSVGGDVEKLPKPLNAVEVKLYDLCVDKANTNAYEEESSADNKVEVPVMEINNEDTAADLVTKLIEALEKRGILSVNKKPPDVPGAETSFDQEEVKQD